MNKLLFFPFIVICACTSCLSRAPSNYELDRRAGMEIPGIEIDKQDLASIRTNSKIAQKPVMPIKIPPLIEKVWIPDLTLGEGAKMQGTWLFLEVEPGKWIDEVDPGSAPLLLPIKEDKK